MASTNPPLNEASKPISGQPSFTHLPPLPSAWSEALCTLLHQIIPIHQSVISTLHQKKLATIEGNMDTLSHLDQALVSLSHQLAEWDGKRHQLLEQGGIPTETPLREIIPLLVKQPGHPHQTLQAIHHHHHHVQRQLEEMAHLNQDINQLLNHSLGWISSAIDTVIKAAQPAGAAYTAQGIAQKRMTNNRPNQALEQYGRGGASTVERRV